MPIVAEPLPYEVTKAARELGVRVRVARKRRRMTQAELSTAIGFSRKTVSNLEAGTAGVSVAVLLSALWRLGLLTSVDGVADPDADEHGKILDLGRLPERVRTPRAVDNDF
jgi:transcriptional regulator with XRE-family HTH domain